MSPSLPQFTGSPIAPRGHVLMPKREGMEGKEVEKCPFGISYYAKKPGPKKAKNVTKNDGKWSTYHPSLDPPSPNASPYPLGSISPWNRPNRQENTQIGYSANLPIANCHDLPHFLSENVTRISTMCFDTSVPEKTSISMHTDIVAPPVQDTSETALAGSQTTPKLSKVEATRNR